MHPESVPDCVTAGSPALRCIPWELPGACLSRAVTWVSGMQARSDVCSEMRLAMMPPVLTNGLSLISDSWQLRAEVEETHEVTHNLSPQGAAQNFHPVPFWMGWAPVHIQIDGGLFLPAWPDCLCAGEGAWHNSSTAPVKLLSIWEPAPWCRWSEYLLGTGFWCVV